jgi:hypothetical protein
MKWLITILLLVNVVYFGWELDRQTRIDLGNKREALIVPAGVKQLVLVKELPKPPKVRKVKEDNEFDNLQSENDNTETDDFSSVNETDMSDVKIQEEFISELMTQMPDISILNLPKTATPKKTMCFSYGPFPDDRQSNELTEWFQQHQVSVMQRLETEKEKQLFWIYLKPMGSLDSARQAIEDLKKQGVRDYRLIETGDLRNAISLGLFSTQALVNKRLNELKNKGYQPVVIPYKDAESVFWLDIKLADQQDILNKMFTGLPARYNSIPVKCSEIALQ